PPVRSSTRSAAVTLPVTWPPMDTDWAPISASTTPSSSTVTNPSATSLPRSTPPITTSSSELTSPSMVMPGPITVVATLLLLCPSDERLSDVLWKVEVGLDLADETSPFFEAERRGLDVALHAPRGRDGDGAACIHV